MSDVPRLRAVADVALDLARRLDRDDLATEAAVLAGSAAVFAGNLTAAGPLFAEGQARGEAAGDAWAVAHALIGHGQAALLAGRHDDAEEQLVAAEEAARRLGNAFTLATALNVRATLAQVRSEPRAAALMLVEATELSVGARISWTLGYAVPALAEVAVRLDDAETAARLFGASASLSAAYSVNPDFPAARALSDQGLADVRERLGDGSFRRAWDAGRSATHDDVAELAARVRLLARG
jgi:hypothetical protein